MTNESRRGWLRFASARRVLPRRRSPWRPDNSMCKARERERRRITSRVGSNRINREHRNPECRGRRSRGVESPAATRARRIELPGVNLVCSLRDGCSLPRFLPFIRTERHGRESKVVFDESADLAGCICPTRRQRPNFDDRHRRRLARRRSRVASSKAGEREIFAER